MVVENDGDAGFGNACLAAFVDEILSMDKINERT